MTNNTNSKIRMRNILLSLATVCCMLPVIGCQSAINGQTLPSPSYLQDDLTYSPAGPEFKLSREAAAQQAARAQEKLN